MPIEEEEEEEEEEEGGGGGGGGGSYGNYLHLKTCHDKSWH
jgi:hypothetical protein